MLRIYEARLGAAPLFSLKTVHRTVFLTLKPSQGSIPFFPQKSYISKPCGLSGVVVTRGGIEPPLPA